MPDLISRSFDLPANSFKIFQIFRDELYAFFLDSSASSHGTLGRYSFIGFDPFDVYSCQNGHALEGLKNKFKKMPKFPASKLTPLPGGAVGFLSYDAGLEWEKIQSRPKKDLPVPRAVFGFYDVVLTIDHWKNKLHVVSRTQKKLDVVVDKIHAGLSFKSPQRKFIAPSDLILKSNFRQEAYYKIIQKILRYIREGDVYQVNLSQQFSCSLNKRKIDPVAVYESLRQQAPSHFTSYFAGKDFYILSSSPERFLQMHGRRVQTRPMKGTRPRGEDRRDDERQRKDLSKSAKDKAELLMVTDLERNDLGRVCEFGSVKVKSLRNIEPYSTVFQATSTVEGILRRDKDAFDLLRACFPGGSITGCPKIRAMQIIEELEPDRRGIYTGILGYLSFSGGLDFNILIRTMLIHKNKISFHVGGGIVADSTPEGEYKETLVKAKAMRACLKEVFKGHDT